MEDNNKICPLTRETCTKSKCAFWCDWGRDCAVPLLAGMFADSEICRNTFVYEDEQNDERH